MLEQKNTLFSLRTEMKGKMCAERFMRNFITFIPRTIPLNIECTK